MPSPRLSPAIASSEQSPRIRGRGPNKKNGNLLAAVLLYLGDMTRRDIQQRHLIAVQQLLDVHQNQHTLAERAQTG